MNIKRAKEEIKNTLRAYLQKDELGEYVIPPLRQRPILLMGPPGIGKTQIMEQVARECGVGLVSYTITHHTRQSAVGLPFIRQKHYAGADRSVTEYTMSEIIASVYQKIEDTGLQEGILFIDEINCVSETLAPTMLQFLQCKTFGNQPVPEGWLIAAAGNPPEYNRSVRDFDIVTLDRVRRMDLEPDLPVWREYARAQQIHPAILAYLELRPKHFYSITADVGGPKFVTARGWEDLSVLLFSYESLGIAVDEGTVGQYLQDEEIARDFAAYLDLYAKYRDDYGVEKIFAGEVSPTVYQRVLKAGFDERISLVSLLISGLNARFAAAHDQDSITDDCYALLKSFRTALDAAPDADACYHSLVSAYAEKLSHGRAAGLLTCRQIAAGSRAAALMKDWQSLLGNGEPFAAVRVGFNAQVRRREESVGQASEALEHCFDFMEKAFPAGQELVVFVTELTLGEDSMRFIRENGCDRYYHYSQSLLLDSRKAAIDKDLGDDAARQEDFYTEL